MILRDYQTEAIDRTREKTGDGFTRILIHSGTGTGKTVIASEITRLAVGLGSHVLFLAHRKELIDQAWNKLKHFGIKAGVMMADDPRRAPWEKVCVASVQTLIRRPFKPKADLIFVDECHRAPADSYQAILALYPSALVVGLTATPCRAGDRGLGDIFQVMVSCPSVADMMARIDPSTGKPYLVGTRVFAPPSVSLKGVKIVRGDYKSDDLAKACDKPKLIGGILEHWKRHAIGQCTVIFAAGIEHSKHIVEQFVAAGIKAEHLDGTMSKDLREAILKRLESGETTVVSNCAVLCEGWDAPYCSCIVLARPTRSVGLFLQMVGRVLRPFPGKTCCIILDHAGCTHEHGFVDDEREWSLDPNQKTNGKVTKAARVQYCKQSVMNCWCERKDQHNAAGDHLACYMAFAYGRDECPACGCPVLKKKREVQVQDGSLVEMVKPVNGQASAHSKYKSIGTPTSRRRVLDALLNKAAKEGKRNGWASHVFKAKFGMEPPRAWMPDDWLAEHQDTFDAAAE